MRSGWSARRSRARIGTTLKSAPVRATAFTKAMQLTSMKPRCAVSRRSWARYGTWAGSGSSAGRTARVSGIASQATAEATSDVTA